MSDEPVVWTADTPLRQTEECAMALYRAKYPDAPLWQDLAVETRMMWIEKGLEP